MPDQAPSIHPRQIVDPIEQKKRFEREEKRRDSGLFLRVGELQSRFCAVAGVRLCGRVACGGLDEQVACATCSENHWSWQFFPMEKN